MWARAMAARDQFRRWRAGLASNERYRQLECGAASYTLVSVKRATTVGLWLAGLNGAALALTATLFVQSYSLIKGD
jgi:hypothetical protein